VRVHGLRAGDSWQQYEQRLKPSSSISCSLTGSLGAYQSLPQSHGSTLRSKGFLTACVLQITISRHPLAPAHECDDDSFLQLNRPPQRRILPARPSRTHDVSITHTTRYIGHPSTSTARDLPPNRQNFPSTQLPFIRSWALSIRYHPACTRCKVHCHSASEPCNPTRPFRNIREDGFMHSTKATAKLPARHAVDR
jgi:hypothetical protein